MHWHIVAAAVTDPFYIRQSSQHRQSSCSVHCTAALPVLAGLADVEGISHTAPNTRGALWGTNITILIPLKVNCLSVPGTVRVDTLLWYRL